MLAIKADDWMRIYARCGNCGWAIQIKKDFDNCVCSYLKCDEENSDGVLQYLNQTCTVNQWKPRAQGEG